MIALVTGGTRGIGLAIVKSFKALGYQVAVVGRSDNVPDCDLYIKCDITERRGIIYDVVGKLGGIDVLVNNAGQQFSGSAELYNYEQWRNSLDLLLTVPFLLCQSAFRFMKEKGRGRIINISSVGGILGTRGIIGYSVAKAGLIEMTKCLSNEWLPYGVTVNAVAPGFIETDMQTLTPEHKQAMMGRIPAGRFGTVEETAAAVTWLASDEARYISGITLPVDGGWLAR